ncbi:DUF6582 domain-containing protein [Paraburkholderia nemoris]|uniref:DUF6582 domain-containing protein n=1 Tax=Paraburkholderia nemoris TaxID=2793076 RepID=UPI001B1D2B1B|nr:DUF6582 domain-containing protein [Paraburkholderia nemoris]CAE6838467.1 hypothetical protein R75777_06950 [Paraburkholderia nemoris]
MPLSKEERDALPPEHFAVPGKRKLPINDETHTTLAWDQVDRTQGLSDAERSEARARILRRAKELGIDTSDWDKSVHAAAMTLWGMSLNVPEVANHPNRMPFSGVLTFVNQPSDLPPGGSGGKRTYLPKDVAEKALESLLGMAVDFSNDLSAHNVSQKIGVITGAEIVGEEVRIEGFFYAADFPQECARIQDEKEDLGFSYEVRAQTRPMGDLLQIVSCVFTGAAVLYKDKAAYQSTSLAAQAEQDIEMTEEQLKALLAGALGPITEQITAVTTQVKALQASSEQALQANKETRDRVAPHATALRNCAAAMEASGIGLHSSQGHVKVLHHMAASMEADAAAGKVPHIFRDHDWGFSASAAPAPTPAPAPALDADNPVIKGITDTLAGLGTQLTDLKAAAFKGVQAPDRKTVPSEVLTLLAKGGIKVEDTKEGLTEGQIDTMLEAAGVTGISARIAAKQQIAQAGLLRK